MRGYRRALYSRWLGYKECEDMHTYKKKKASHMKKKGLLQEAAIANNGEENEDDLDFFDNPILHL